MNFCAHFVCRRGAGPAWTVSFVVWRGLVELRGFTFCKFGVTHFLVFSRFGRPTSPDIIQNGLLIVIFNGPTHLLAAGPFSNPTGDP